MKKTTTNPVETIIHESPDASGMALDPDIHARLFPHSSLSYNFRKITKREDGTIVVTVVEDLNMRCFRHIDAEIQAKIDDPKKWPEQQVIVEDPDLARTIALWSELKCQEIRDQHFIDRIGAVLRAANLDPVTVKHEREKWIKEMHLTDDDVATARQNVLEREGLDDKTLLQKRQTVIAEHGLDDASIEAKCEAELKKHGLM